MVSVVDSHAPVVPEVKVEVLLVYTAFQDTVVVAIAETVTVLGMVEVTVLTVTGVFAAPLTGIAELVYNTVPSQVPLSYSVNTTVPDSAVPPVDVIVVESSGCQF